MKASMKSALIRRAVFAILPAVLLLAGASAMATPPPKGTTTPAGATPIITVPPRTLSQIQSSSDTSADSTLFSQGIPAPKPSSFQLPLSGGTGTGTGTGSVCAPNGSYPTSDCPALTCPSSYAGTPSYTCTCNSAGTGYASTPTQTQVNASPTSYGCIYQACTPNAGTAQSNCPALTCPSGYGGTPGYTCACNSGGTGYVSTPTQAEVNASPTSYGCALNACIPNASEPVSDCGALVCPSGYAGTPTGTCACNGSGTGYVSTPTQADVNANPTGYGCTVQTCTPNSPEPTADCPTLTCPSGYTGAPSDTCACNSGGTGYVSSPTQATVTSDPTAYGCTATATCRHLGSVSQIQGHWCCQEQWDPSSGTCGTLYTYCTSLAVVSEPVGLCPTYGAPAPSGEVLCNTLGTTVSWCPGS